ncbi:unnamed protein product [Rhizophagus irregularis]|nr:unnamed protein product [Rhizophagus irregularis]
MIMYEGKSSIFLHAFQLSPLIILMSTLPSPTNPDPPTPTNDTTMIKLSSSPPTLTIPDPPTPTTDTTLPSPITTVPTGTTITSVPPTSTTDTAISSPTIVTSRPCHHQQP